MQIRIGVTQTDAFKRDRYLRLARLYRGRGDRRLAKDYAKRAIRIMERTGTQ